MIHFANPSAQYLAHQAEIDCAIQSVLKNGIYILGENVSMFESEFANYIGTRHAIGVANGTDALILALKGLYIGVDDEVIIPSMTATATASAVSAVGAKSIFADIEKDYYTLDPKQVECAITKKTKAIIAVHLYGQPANIIELQKIAKKHGLLFIEDCAQAIGAYYHDKPVGSFGDLACFSFFPTKNLGAIGDGGAVVTNNEQVSERIHMLRQYGWDKNRESQFFGMNSRLDELQAAILRVKLKYLDLDTKKRGQIAENYNIALKNSSFILPKTRNNCSHAYHLYVIQCENRDEMIKKLHKKNIMVGVHYSKAIHQMPAYFNAATKLPITEKLTHSVISLPIYPELSQLQQETINSCIHDIL